MKSQHLPISYEEFQRMPKRLGWKYEYYGDCAHITPGHAIVVTAVEITPCVVNTPCTIRPVVEADLPQLRPAYFAAFEETTDYCDWAPKRIKEAAEQNLSSFFAGKRGEPLSASQIATAEQNDGREEVIGTILIVEKEDGPLVDLLFVVPDWHRKGVATALASTALNVLHTSGNEKLRSRFLLGNAESRQWHHRFGFVDEPDLWVARAHTHTHITITVMMN
ncbi:GNAT family N-acetyltransferase [Chloroflexi bacterium TSY]|nr:GNAT family N-acetyltransferase [Chloroflexi bacterium TSY]